MASKKKPELRTAAMHVLVRPSVKAKAVAAAAADKRSLASWLEIVVEEAADRALAHDGPPQRAGGAPQGDRRSSK